MRNSSKALEVVVTGVGPVTVVGVGAEACWRGIKGRETAVRRRSMAVDIGKQVELSIADLSQTPPPELERVLRFLEEQQCAGARDLAYAILDAKLTWSRQTNRGGMVQVFEAPGVESTVAKLFGLFQAPPPMSGPPPVYDLLADRFYNMQAFVYVHLLAKALGLHGFCTSVHNACSSGAFAIEVAADCIRQGRADFMIVAGGEAFDTAVRLEWFRRLDLYCCTDMMRPFAAPATGFYVGEGAAALVLESAEHAEKRGAAPYAVYEGGAFAHQGWKQTLPDVAAARLSEVIIQGLNVAGAAWPDIDLVIPHGAGTALSDRYEAECVAKSLREYGGAGGGESAAHAAVFKPAFGHLLGASGLVETAAGLLCLRHQCVPPCIGPAADRRFPVPFSAPALPRKLHRLLKLSTGFTGHDAASLFRAV